MEDGYGRFLLVFGFAMGSDRAAFADGCARQEAGGRPPGAERDRPRAQMRRALGGLRRCLWTEEDTLQSPCALGRARHLGGYLQCAGRHPGYPGPAIHRQQLHQGPPLRWGWKRGALAHGMAAPKAAATLSSMPSAMRTVETLSGFSLVDAASPRPKIISV